MCCDPKSAPRHPEMSECITMMTGCCCTPQRKYFSTKEKVEKLETYKDQLEKELAGVEERIKEIKGA